MSVLQLFDVTFAVVLKNPAGQAGGVYQYRRPERRATISAASPHPKDLLTVLLADIPLAAGESLEILSSEPHPAVGSEGGGILA